MEILKQQIENVPDKYEATKSGGNSPKDNVWFDAEKKQLAATNMNIIAYVPVETDKEDLTQAIPPTEKIKTAEVKINYNKPYTIGSINMSGWWSCEVVNSPDSCFIYATDKTYNDTIDSIAKAAGKSQFFVDNPKIEVV